MKLWEYLKQYDMDKHVIIERNDGRIIYDDKIKNVPQVWYNYLIDNVDTGDELVVTLPL